MNLSSDKAQDSFLQYRHNRTAHPNRRAVVVAEDNVGDVFLVKEAVAATKLDVDLYFFSDGDETVHFFARIDEDSVVCPELLLLDLNIPKRDGFQVLSYLRSSKRCAGIRAVVMTSSSARADREKSASFKVDSYFNKPGTYAEFLMLGDVIRQLI